MKLNLSIVDSLRPGDLVLFSGVGFTSKFIQLTNRSKWSHVGIVTSLNASREILLFESTAISNVKDHIDGVFKKGVQITLLSDRISKYHGTVSVRRLSNALTKTQCDILLELQREIYNRKYEKNILELILAVFDFKFASLKKENLSTVFCSELVAEALQRMGIISNTLPANEYLPKDFGKFGKCEKYLNGYTYSDEIIIK